MKITVISGCADDNLLGIEVNNRLGSYLNRVGITYSIINLNEIKVKHCLGCDSCQSIKPGACCIDDGINEILKQYLQSDTVIIISPIQFGCFNSITKNFIDRTEPLFLPYQVSKKGTTIMKERYDRYPDIIYMGINNGEDGEDIETFKKIASNCNLSTASKKVNVEIINHNMDLSLLQGLKLG